MNPEAVFRLCNSAALGGWALLVFFGRKKWAAPLVTGALIPALLGGAYLFLIATHFSEGSGSFSTLEGVASLFSNRWLLLAGWIHYLAFDLFIGSWQVRDAQRHGIPHWWTIPGLLLTFWFGPVGLLVYFAMLGVKARSLTLD